jgi:methyl-accepting chemotaxis protein
LHRLSRFSSLSTRLVVAVLATATIAFAVLYGLTFIRLGQGLERQAAELGRLSEERLGQRLDGEARLAGAQLETLFETIGRRIEGIAQRADVVKVIAAANVVPIWDLLGRTGRAADVDGILVVDAKLRVLGADKDSVDIAAAYQALRAHPLAQEMLPLLADNDRKHPRVIRRTLPLTADLAKALGAKETAPLALVIVEPMFDDFGDVFAALVAHRALRPTEAILSEFSRLEGAGLMVLDDGRPVSSAGIANPAVTMGSVEGSSLLRTSDAAYWSRCTAVFETWHMCALTPVNELHVLRDQLVRVGEMEGRSLTKWLIIVTAVSLVSFAVITLWASRRISRPLTRITEAVRAVARGDWKFEVPGADRKDEIGGIARAVVVLQRSLQERDRLRSDVAQAESVKKRREALEDAIRRFDRTMRAVLLSVSDTVETMDETARDLARTSAVAEGEAAETAFVSEHTVSNVAILRSATERLSASISETVDRIRQATETIGSSSSIAETAFLKAEHLAKSSSDIEVVIRSVDEIASQVNVLAMNATVQAARGGEGIGTIVADVKELAERVARANEEIGRRMSVVRGATDETAGSVRAVAHKLDLVLHQAKTIALAVERQDAVTREIAENMSATATGTADVSSSVDRLKTTIEEARGASMKVVAKATDMADEAHRLDLTVKTFLREVTA